MKLFGQFIVFWREV